MALLRAALLDAISPDDLRAVVAKLVEMAKVGDLAAIRELLDRTLGKPPAAVAVGMMCEEIRVTNAEDGHSSNTRATVDERRRELLAMIESKDFRQRRPKPNGSWTSPGKSKTRRAS